MDSVVLSSRLERVQSDSDSRTEIPCNLPAALSSTNKAGCLVVAAKSETKARLKMTSCQVVDEKC